MPSKTLPRDGIPSIDALHTWLQEEHPGYQSNLICKDIPSEAMSESERGMFGASDIKPGQSLLQMPSSALLNPLTLISSPLNTIPHHLFPLSDRIPPIKKKRHSISTRLNTTQILTLHLLLSRDPRDRHPSSWKVYLKTLPTFDGSHPLTWFYGKGDRDQTKLLEYLPESTRERLDDVKQRYETDKEVLKGVLRDESVFSSEKLVDTFQEGDYLFAWLNINTRSVSIPLGIAGTSSLQNHTLVPMLDMLNHTSSPTEMIPRPQQIPSTSISANTKPIRGNNTAHLIPGKIGFKLIASSNGLKEDEEVLFEYGSHPSDILFTEYGFVEQPKNKAWTSLRHGSLDLGWLVDSMWKEKGDDERKGVLEDIGCSRQNAIDSSPGPPHPSHSLLMTLRLLHYPPSISDPRKLQSISTGSVTYISPRNESQVNATLQDMCERVVEESKSGLKRVRVIEKAGTVDPSTLRDIVALWEEQEAISKGMVERLKKGEVDW